MAGVRVLFGLLPLSGHVNPILPVAQHLSNAGCAIAVFSSTSVKERFQRAGVPIEAEYRPEDAMPLDQNLTLAGAEHQLRRFNDAAWLTRYYQMHSNLEADIRIMNAAIEAFRPDVVSMDPQFLGAALSAEKSGLPWAGLAIIYAPWVPDEWRCAYNQALEALHPPVLAAGAALGVSMGLRIGNAISPWLNTTFSIPELTPTGVGPRDYAIPVGPSRAIGKRGDEPDFPWDRLDPKRPLIYATSGTVFLFPRKFYTTLIEAVRPLGAQLVIAGPGADEDLGPDAITVRYAPSVLLMQRASLIINHGGVSSVMESLSAGQPMLVVPCGLDQPWQVKFIERCGAGRGVDHATASVTSLRETISAMLEPLAPERARARELAASCREHDGGQRAAELLMKLAHTRRPILPAS